MQESRFIDQGNDAQPRRGRPRRYLIGHNGIYDKESDSYISQLGSQSQRWDLENFIEPDIFIVTTHSKEERQKHIEEFKRNEEVKAQKQQEIIDRVREEKEQKAKEEEEKKRKRQEEQMKQKNQNEGKDGKPKKRRRKQQKKENEDISEKSPAKHKIINRRPP